jgi:hypothetical protein
VILRSSSGRGSAAPFCVRWWHRAGALRRRDASLAVTCALIAACGSYDGGLLDEHTHGAGIGPGDRTGDAAVDRDAGAAGSSGAAGMGADAGDPGIAGSTGSAAGDCIFNPDPSEADCPLICRESCNGSDDDCDGAVDEAGMDEGCALANAVSACVAGECRIVECTGTHRDCDDAAATGCEAAEDDPSNCGQCGRVCDLPNVIEACVDGECEPAGCEPLFGDCDAEPNDCETATNTLENCELCGVGCSDVPNATASCASGACGPGECMNGYGDCNTLPEDGCEHNLDSLEHCGSCGDACDLPGAIDDCSSDVCLAIACQSGYDDCDSDPTDGCESLSGNDDCGACNTPCSSATLPNVAGATCSSMQCQLECAAGFADCDEDATTGCETDVRNNDRCGSCDTPCEIPNAVVDCAAGRCEFVRCRDNFGDCNDDLLLDGCETSLNLDQTCGSCDVDCTMTTDPVCVGGRCTDVICPTPNTADCNQDGLPCEVDLETNVSHCGACGAACAFTAATPHASTGLTCVNGGCRPVCDALWANCNGDYRDGCETSLTTLSNCGGCGSACAISNASATCAGGTCRVDGCGSDWADCNVDDVSCETQLGTTSNCTGCGMACTLANAVPTCAGAAGSHSCAVAACTQTHFANCDGTASNGCEIDRRTSTANCGSCGNNCSSHPHVASATCSSSACNYTCSGGWGNCTSATGCETPLDTNTDCTGCGVACSRSNGTASCSTGSCQLTGCNAGHDDCDGNANNGCEPLTSLQNCGACGTHCSIVNATASCATQTCQLASCNSGWADCDGVQANGCERNVTPPAMGGLGPCQPDTGCTQFTFGGRAYYFCTGARSWADARTRCQLQLLGDLVHIDDAAEDAFVLSHLVASAWIGAQDTTEGSWRWANDSALFWTGGSAGTASAYAHWNSGEPNDFNGAEDCAEIRHPDGLWNDQACANASDFVCEVQADLCPADPNKANPGQCGCGVADTDTDGDGTANCNDGCPNDAPKVAPGQCGCAVADSDGDGDGTANCNDGCPSDGAKTTAGQCGCGVADSDGDGDGTASCVDGCPVDPTQTTACLSFAPNNFDPTPIDWSAQPSSTLDCGATTVNTTDPDGAGPRVATLTNWCGTDPVPVAQNQSGGPQVVVIPLRGLSLTSGNTLRVLGARPLILAVDGSATIAGVINGNASGTTAGAGGNWSCGSSQGSNGTGSTDRFDGATGGGGGGFGTAGGRSGVADTDGSDIPGANGGAARGSTTLTPLYGGCAGGQAGDCGTAGAAGGGALQLSVSGTLTITGSVRVNGGNGATPCGASDEGGGSGGGSGGAILLEASTLTTSGATIQASGGNGGANGTYDGIYSCGGTSGGSGSSSASNAGGNGSSCQAGSPGGGGGYGRIRTLDR